MSAVGTRLGITALLSTALAAQVMSTPGFRTEQFHGRHAYVLENGKIRVSLLRGGGHIAETRFLSPDTRKNVNPLRVPHYPTIEPYEYNDAKHNALYGDDPHRWMSSGYMGHFVCFPIFGPPSSKEEAANGIGNHGEAPIVEWKPIGDVRREGAALVFAYGADLPKTQFHIERRVTLRDGESLIHIEETVESLTNFDRPINWMQHATFGPPFAVPGKSFLDLSGTKGQVAGGAIETSSLKPNSTLNWPDGVGKNGEAVSLRPFQPNANSGTYFAVLMDQTRKLNYLTMYNSDFEVLIGYLLRKEDSPWLGDFQENQRMANKPWNREVVTRGIEFGTTPFAEGLRRSIERGNLFGIPTYRWIGGKQKLKMDYVLFLAEIPKGFRGVQDVKLSDGAIRISESGTSKTISVSAAGLSSLQ